MAKPPTSAPTRVTTVKSKPLAPPADNSASKRDHAIALMRRPEGATIEELMAATRWLPHSTRAVISGLRKAGLAVIRTRRDGMSCYTIGGGE